MKYDPMVHIYGQENGLTAADDELTAADKKTQNFEHRIL